MKEAKRTCMLLARVSIILIGIGASILNIVLPYPGFYSAFAEENEESMDQPSYSDDGEDDLDYDGDSNTLGNETEADYESPTSINESSPSNTTAISEIPENFDITVLTDENSMVVVNVFSPVKEYLEIDDSSTKVQLSHSPALFGSVKINSDNTLTYVPYQLGFARNQTITDIFRYSLEIMDGSSTLHYCNGTITVLINQANDAPEVFNSDYTTNKNTELSLHLTAYDQDGDALNFTIVSGPRFGQYNLDSSAGIFDYTPYHDYVGDDTITYQVSDGISYSTIATVKLTMLNQGNGGQDEGQQSEQQESDSLSGDDGEESNEDSGSDIADSSDPENPIGNSDVTDGTSDTTDTSNSSAPEVNFLAASGVTAKGYERKTDYVPSNTIDNNLDTRWSNPGKGSWILYDLGQEYTISYVDIAWYLGDERINNLVISTSTDGAHYTQAFSGESSGETVSPERYDFADIEAQYVKVTVNGNTENNWASITEVSIYGLEQ
jgi:F5/8 type C domain-containing protein/Big-like domain-containing protein